MNMKSFLVFLLPLSLAVAGFAQEPEAPQPSASSQKYSLYRRQLTLPVHSVSKVLAMIKTIKRNEEENRPLAPEKFNALTIRERFAYVMLHGEDFAQNCDAMPQIIDEDKKIFATFPSPFANDLIWSDQQRGFLTTYRSKVTSLLKESIQARKRVGLNFKQAILELRATSLLPELTTIYKRDRRDHDILSLVMLLMVEGKYQPFLQTSLYKTLYGAESNYQSHVALNKANSEKILNLGMAFYRDSKK